MLVGVCVPLEDELANDLREAMRAGEAIRRDTIRLLRSALHNESIARGRPLESDESIAVVRRLINQHHDSIAEFERGRRDDLVAREQAELEILQPYLPEELSRDVIVSAAREAIASVGASGRQDQGKVMKELAPRLRGKADMRLVSEVVLELLA
ncbi:MAG: hypothetical protein HW416_647 [Chloroflexi bacterium]|nr:hypothetical protein [Chloroflexota bacterium]